MAWENSDRRERLPSDWDKRRRKVMRDHRGVCHVCGRPGADAVDHVRRGDDHSYPNLRPIHQDVPPFCHRAKTAREAAQARAAIRAARYRTPETHPGRRGS